MGKERSPYKPALDGLYQYLSAYVPLTQAEFSLILPFIEIRQFDKKVTLVQAGETEQYLNIVAKGLIRKYLPVRGEEVTIQLAIEGHIVHSEISFHNRTPSDPVVETIEPTTLLSISHDSLEELYDKMPKVERLGRLIISDLFIKKDFRYFSQLKMTTRERFLDYVRNHPRMIQRVPQKYIASYLNIEPETFSRLKHLMKPPKPS